MRDKGRQLSYSPDLNWGANTIPGGRRVRHHVGFADLAINDLCCLADNVVPMGVGDAVASKFQVPSRFLAPVGVRKGRHFVVSFVVRVHAGVTVVCLVRAIPENSIRAFNLCESQNYNSMPKEYVLLRHTEPMFRTVREAGIHCRWSRAWQCGAALRTFLP